MLRPKGVYLLNAHQAERCRTSKNSYKFLNKRRYTYLELQYLAIEKISSTLKKKKFVRLIRQIRLYHILEQCEQNLSDDVTQSHVIKICVRKTSIDIIMG